MTAEPGATAEQLREMSIDNAILAAAVACGADGPALCDSIALRQRILAAGEPGAPGFARAVQQAVRATLTPSAPPADGEVLAPGPAAGEPPAESVPGPAPGDEPQGPSGEQIAAMTNADLLAAMTNGELEGLGIGARRRGPLPGLTRRLTNAELASRGGRTAVLGREYGGEIGPTEVRDARPEVVEHWQRTGRLSHLGVGVRPDRGMPR